MLIVCPNCATSYRVFAENFGHAGRSVRCVSCHHVWLEEPHPAPSGATGAMPMPAAAEFTARSAIRPPLDDVVEIGTPHSQPDSGEAMELRDPGDSYLMERQDPAFGPEPWTLDRSPSIVPSQSSAEANTWRNTTTRRKAPWPSLRRRQIIAAATTMPALVGALVLMLGGLVTFRQQVVHQMPQTASLYAALGMPVNLRALQFENVKTAHETKDGIPVLVVEGDIVGTSARLTEIPQLRFAVVDRAGKEIYAWTSRPDRTLLPPGETLPFRSRLASPPAEASGINVRFFNRHDNKAGIM